MHYKLPELFNFQCRAPALAAPHLLTLAVYQEALYSVVTSSPGYSSCQINTEYWVACYLSYDSVDLDQSREKYFTGLEIVHNLEGQTRET